MDNLMIGHEIARNANHQVAATKDILNLTITVDTLINVLVKKGVFTVDEFNSMQKEVEETKYKKTLASISIVDKSNKIINSDLEKITEEDEAYIREKGAICEYTQEEIDNIIKNINEGLQYKKLGAFIFPK